MYEHEVRTIIDKVLAEKGIRAPGPSTIGLGRDLHDVSVETFRAVEALVQVDVFATSPVTALAAYECAACRRLLPLRGLVAQVIARGGICGPCAVSKSDLSVEEK